MQGKLDIRYSFPDNAKLKTRLVAPEGVDFTKACRKAIEDATLEILNTNALTVRAAIEKKLKEAGFSVKREAYQKHIDADSKSMLRCLFGTKENMPADTFAPSAPAASDVPADEAEPEVKLVDEIAEEPEPQAEPEKSPEDELD